MCESSLVLYDGKIRENDCALGRCSFVVCPYAIAFKINWHMACEDCEAKVCGLHVWQSHKAKIEGEMKEERTAGKCKCLIPSFLAFFFSL